MSARDFVRRHVLHNLGLKITSLMLAVALWLAIASSPESEVALRVPIIFRNMPAQLDISSENVPEAQIRVRGPEGSVRRLQPSDLRVEINLTGAADGDYTFDLTKAVGVPNGLEVVQVIPSQIHVAFDHHSTRAVPVKPRTTGAASDEYAIAQIASDPATVEVVGPKRHVDAVDAAVTDPVDISGATDQVIVERAAYVSDPLVQVSNPRPVRITITMQKGPAKH